MSSPWQPNGGPGRDEADTGVRTGPFARAASSDSSSIGGGSAARPQGASATSQVGLPRGVESGGAPSSLGAIGEPVPFQGGPFANHHGGGDGDVGSPAHQAPAARHRRRTNGPFDAAGGAGPSSVTASFDDHHGSPFGGLGSIGDSIGLSFNQTASHAIPIGVGGGAGHSGAAHVNNSHREDPYGSLPFADASSAPQHGGSVIPPPVSTGRISASGGASAPASVNLAALTPDWILAATSPNTASSVIPDFPVPPAVAAATGTAAPVTPQKQHSDPSHHATSGESPRGVAAAAAEARASPSGKFANSGSRGRASSGTAVLSAEVLAAGIDRALAEQLRGVDGSATCTLADAIARSHKARLAAGVPATGNVTFPAEGGDRAVQVFVGQLPACVTAEALGAVIDNLLGLHAVPKMLHMRTPAANSSQAAHALVTIEARHQRALLALNRRCYFTVDAVFYVSSGKETAAFQRAIARTVAAVIAADANGSPKLSRACVVVEPANRNAGNGTPQGRGPSADGSAMRHRKSPLSARATPGGAGRVTPGGGGSANGARYHHQAPPSYAMQPSPTHSTAMAQAGGPTHHHHHHHFQPQHVPAGYVVMGAPPSAPMHPAVVGSTSSSPTATLMQQPPFGGPPQHQPPMVPASPQQAAYTMQQPPAFHHQQPVAPPPHHHQQHQQQQMLPSNGFVTGY